MVGAAGNRIHLQILPRVEPIKGIFLTRIYTSEFRVRTALITLRNSRSLKPARILSSHTPGRSQGCRATGSAISRWSQSLPFCCFWPRKWTWLTHPRCEHTHNFFLDAFQSTPTSQKISVVPNLLARTSTRAQNSIATVSNTHLTLPTNREV